MFSITNIILCLSLLNFLILVESAHKLLTEDSYGIVATERVIRSTVNNIFFTLKLKAPPEPLKLEKYSITHNVFAAITLRDHDSLKKIETITQVDNFDNGTTIFMTQLNEVLKEDNKSDEETDSLYVTILMEEFLKKLYTLKEKFDVKNTTNFFDLNKAIIKRHFNAIENEFDNTTNLEEEFVEGNDSIYKLLGTGDYWQPSGRRIYQGQPAKISRFPFMASVLIFNQFQCAGSIIRADLIITAASCLQLAWNNRYYRENPDFLSVQVGTKSYKQDGENIAISEIFFNPNYDPKTLRHNLALMRLSRILKIGKYNKNVKMIDFDKNPSPLPSNIGGIVIIGWGSRNPGNKVEMPVRNKLTFAILDFYPLKDCQEVYSREYVTDRNFCAGFYSKGGGACNHDAGGPGVSIGNGVLLGVISFGSPICGTPDAPTVFTKLGYYADWIEKIKDMAVITKSQSTTHRAYFKYRYTLKTPRPKRVTPVQDLESDEIALERPAEGESLRMKDKKHNFEEFLKTIFKNKQQKQQQQQQQKEIQQEEEKEEISENQSKPQYVKEIHQFTNIIETETKTEGKSTSNPETTDVTTTLEAGTSLAVNQEKTTTLYDNKTHYTGSDYLKEYIPPIKHQNKTKEGKSPTQEKELDEGSDSFNIKNFLESHENLFEVSARDDPHRIRAKEQHESKESIESNINLINLTPNKENKPRTEIENKTPNAEDEYSINYESIEDENENSDSEYEDDEDTADRVQISTNVESNRAQDTKLRTDIKNVDYESSYDSDTDEEYEFLSIPIDTYKQENTSTQESASTEALMQMLEYEDVVKLLVEEVIR